LKEEKSDMVKKTRKCRRPVLLAVFLAAAAAVLALWASNSLNPHLIRTVPTPALIRKQEPNPFEKGWKVLDPESLPILYATNRVSSDSREPGAYYSNERSDLVRLGTAGIEVADNSLTWEDIVSIPDKRIRWRKPFLRVGSVEETGIVPESETVFTRRQSAFDTGQDSEMAFLTALSDQLTRSNRKDVFIYVHGYNVNFDRTLMITAQLRHYSGYQGAFIAYSWPSMPLATSYLKALDTAAMSARSFRIFLKFLADQDDVETIHILAYSAGSRLVTQTLHQMALESGGGSGQPKTSKSKLGTVILAGSDIDRSVFGSYLTDGILDNVERLRLYTSSRDRILKFAELVHWSSPRMGQTITEKNVTPEILEILHNEEKIEIIDVSDAVSVSAQGGHYYFLLSPWVSSDVLLGLLTGRNPENRGLVPHLNLPYWKFPPDYIERSLKLIGDAP